MSQANSHRSQIRIFEETYAYDGRYMHDLLDASAELFEVFTQTQSLGSYRKALPKDAHAVAAFAVMEAEDCGSCANLNLKMAVEAGVDRAVLESLVKEPAALPKPLASIYRYTKQVVTGREAVDPALGDRLCGELGAEAFAELAACIAGARIYPTLKRALLRADSCEWVSLLALDSSPNA